jgi:acetate kinase
MNILALNCGSSSIKAAVIDAAVGERTVEIHVDKLGAPQCRVQIDKDFEPLPNADARAALTKIMDIVSQRVRSGLKLSAIAHRVVHGGKRFVRPTRIDDAVMSDLFAVSKLAPLHNPPALDGIRAARERFPDQPHVAIFDTAFHATLPPRARDYALPIELREKFGIRRFGFHGTNHAHVMRSVAAFLKSTPQQLRIVSCHLGNGSSAAAIEYGRSIDTSMGMTPLEGLVMGTRAGDVDPGVLVTLQREANMNVDALDELLNKQSGLLGLTGTNDVRDIEQRAAQGDDTCRAALTLYSHRVRKYIGAYAAVMGGVDVIAFTGGIGEGSASMRNRILQRLEFLGARMSVDSNSDVRVTHEQPVQSIADEASRVQILVVRADEELQMARETADLLGLASKVPGPHRIPIAVSARHAHLSQRSLDGLFGSHYQLQPRTALSQTGQFSAQETVTLIGPRGKLEHVRLMGPPRAQDQIEISRTDEFMLGVDAPVRVSGDVSNTPGITIEGPLGRVTISSGVICARRHIHMGTADAERFGVKDHDTVRVRIDSSGRDLVFEDVVVRVSPEFKLELHLDTDEANAAGVDANSTAELLLRT